MKPYRYIKDKPKTIPGHSGRTKTIFWRGASLVSLFGGIFSLGLAAWPIASYQIKQKIQEAHPKLVSPVPDIVLLESKGFISPLKTVAQASEDNRIKGVKVIEEKDLTLAANWFPQKNYRLTEAKVTHYLLSIPKLKIDRAVVMVGGNDLKKSLIQYPGTAIPGQLGNTVILGHSVLPMFYDPKSYNTIFSKLPSLEEGDKVTIEFDGITYTYVVHEYYEREPEQVDLMEQKFDRYELSLVTCVPPGTDIRRGIIRAFLQPE